MQQSQPTRLNASERGHYARGRERFLRGDVDGALEAFERLVRTRDGFADVHYMMGVMLENRGEEEAAADSLRRAIRLNPSYAEALLALATVYERAGDFGRSRELAERAAMVSRGAPGVLDATTRGKLANLQAAMGDAYADAGELRDAIDAYRKALDRCPEFHDIRFRLAVVLRDAGLPDRSLRELKRVLRGNPDYLDAQIQLGLTYYTLGRADDAMTQWEQALRRDPSRDDARMFGRLVRAGRAPTPQRSEIT